jgi:hypothetical protein
MSLLDKASLIVTPNAYKESKLYSVVPNTTLGDMDVVRATTATRVNSAGLIEEVPRNLLTYSQDFTNASWSKSGVTITANTTVAPNGTTTASKLVEDGFLVTYGVYKGITTGFRYSHSIYAKKGERDWIKVNAVHGGNQSVWFNLANGTIGTNNTTGTPSIENVGNGWYRCVIKNTDHSVAASFYSVMPCTNNNIETYTGTIGNGIFIWGAQLDKFATATEYFPTTTRLNIPRIDYTNGSCPSLLVEPQRTNLFTYSNTFSNAAWSKNSCTISANSIVSPDGIQNASKLVEGTANDSHHIYQNVISSGQNTFTFYAKQGERKFVYAYAESAGQGKCFDLENGTLGVNIIAAPLNSSITSVGNGWYRCSITISITATALRIGACSANGTFSYLGNGTSGFYLYGAQLEAGSYPTSYIPTVASTVTRNADVISKTGISTLIGQTEGTIYAEIKVNKLIGTSSRYIFHISDGTVNNRIYMAFSGASSNVIRARIFNGGTLQCSINSSTITTTGTYKLALAYKNNDIVFYINGVEIGTDIVATIPTCSKVDIGHNYAGASQLGDGVANANIFKTRLTNTELAQLTTL